jgi:hypothetical protein
MEESRMKELLEKLKSERTVENLPMFATVLAEIAGTGEACELFVRLEKMAQDMGLSEKSTGMLKQIAARMVIAVAIGELTRRMTKKIGIYDEKTEEGIDAFFALAAHEGIGAFMRDTAMALIAVI